MIRCQLFVSLYLAAYQLKVNILRIFRKTNDASDSVDMKLKRLFMLPYGYLALHDLTEGQPAA